MNIQNGPGPTNDEIESVRHNDDILYGDCATSDLVELLKNHQEDYSIFYLDDAKSAFINLRMSKSFNHLVQSPHLLNFNEQILVAFDKDIPFYIGKSSRFNINEEKFATVASQRRLLLSADTHLTAHDAKRLGAQSYVVFNTLVEQQATALEEYMITNLSNLRKDTCVNNGTSGTSYVSQVDLNGVIVYRVFVTIYNGLEDMFKAGLLQICRLSRAINKAASVVTTDKAQYEKMCEEKKKLLYNVWIRKYELLQLYLKKVPNQKSYETVFKTHPEIKDWSFYQQALFKTGRMDNIFTQFLVDIDFFVFAVHDNDYSLEGEDDDDDDDDDNDDDDVLDQEDVTVHTTETVMTTGSGNTTYDESNAQLQYVCKYIEGDEELENYFISKFNALVEELHTIKMARSKDNTHG